MTKSQNNHESDPDDQLLFNIPLEHAEHHIVEAMKKANISPTSIYAFQKTGLLIGEDNEGKISKRNRKQWDEAIAENRRKNSKWA